MKTAFRSALIALLAMAHVGCTSLQPVSKDCTGGACTAGLVAGDEIIISTRDQKELALTVQQADARQVVGQTHDRPARSMTVAADEIASIQKRTISAAKTTGAVVATGFAVGAIIVTISAMGLATALIAM